MSKADLDAVRYEPAGEGGVGRLVLARPDRRNAMSPELLGAFLEKAEVAARDPGLRCLIVTGEGSCFSAGADLKGSFQTSEGRASERARLPHERSFAMYEPFLKVLEIEVPVIGALNGHAVGGGFGLALACDMRVADRDARYGANFTRLGLHPGMAISYLLPRLVGLPRASELLYTGRLFRGEEGERMGLFNAAVPAAEVLPRAEALAAEIARAAPIAVRMTKRTVRRGLGWRIREAAFEEAYAQSITVGTEDAGEGVSALLEKREPEFRGR